MWSGARYDEVADPQASWGKAVIERLDIARDALVLDAGCGSGRVTEALLQQLPAVRVIALDNSASMLVAARARLASYGDRIRFVHADLAEDFGTQCLAKVSFDAVISTGALHWVLDHETLFGRIRELLRPRGQFVAQFGGEGSVESVRLQLDRLGIAWRPYNNYASQADTRRALSRAGFGSLCCWSHDETVAFKDRAALAAYLAGGVIGPYVSHLEAEQQRVVSQRVAEGLGELVLRFVRVNVVAER